MWIWARAAQHFLLAHVQATQEQARRRERSAEVFSGWGTHPWAWPCLPHWHFQSDLAFANTGKLSIWAAWSHVVVFNSIELWTKLRLHTSGEIKANKVYVFYKWWTFVKKLNSLKPKPRGVLCFDWCIKQRKKVVSPGVLVGDFFGFFFWKTVY